MRLGGGSGVPRRKRQTDSGAISVRMAALVAHHSQMA
jgi:hypothetical protein